MAVGTERDVDATYADWFAAHEVVAALQRPDFHLYGAAPDVGDVASLVASLRDALVRATPAR